MLVVGVRVTVTVEAVGVLCELVGVNVGGMTGEADGSDVAVAAVVTVMVGAMVWLGEGCGVDVGRLLGVGEGVWDGGVSSVGVPVSRCKGAARTATYRDCKTNHQQIRLLLNSNKLAKIYFVSFFPAIRPLCIANINDVLTNIVQ